MERGEAHLTLVSDSQFQIPEGTFGTWEGEIRQAGDTVFQIPEGTFGTHNI